MAAGRQPIQFKIVLHRGDAIGIGRVQLVPTPYHAGRAVIATRSVSNNSMN